MELSLPVLSDEQFDEWFADTIRPDGCPEPHDLAPNRWAKAAWQEARSRAEAALAASGSDDALTELIKEADEGWQKADHGDPYSHGFSKGFQAGVRRAVSLRASGTEQKYEPGFGYGMYRTGVNSESEPPALPSREEAYAAAVKAVFGYVPLTSRECSIIDAVLALLPSHPARVTDEMVERALEAWWKGVPDQSTSDADNMRSALEAALFRAPSMMPESKWYISERAKEAADKAFGAPSEVKPHECDYSSRRCDAGATLICDDAADPRCPDHEVR